MTTQIRVVKILSRCFEFRVTNNASLCTMSRAVRCKGPGYDLGSANVTRKLTDRSKISLHRFHPNLYNGRAGVGESRPNFQLLMPSLNLLKCKIPYGKGRGRQNFQLMMMSLNLIKSKISHISGRRVQAQLPTFDAESKSAKI